MKIKLREKNSRMHIQKCLDILGDCSSFWGEINYFAFDVHSIELKIELFNRLYQKAANDNKTYDYGS